MTNTTDSWQLQTLDSPKVLNSYTLQVHHAAQLVAMVGHSLLPKEKDDSQSNMEWSTRRHAILGRDIELNQVIRMGLIYHPFELHLFDHNLDSLDNLNLEGRTMQLAINWIKDHIDVLGGNGAQVKPISHFTLPKHPLDKGAVFELPTPVLHIEMAKYRSNADLILKELAGRFEHATEVRIWPHHFDTGCFIPLAFDDQGQPSHAMGLGLAVADGMMDEYYYYITHQVKGHKPEYVDLPDLAGGGEWKKGEWVGAVLPVSRLLKSNDAHEQHVQALSFFESGIAATMQLLGLEN